MYPLVFAGTGFKTPRGLHSAHWNVCEAWVCMQTKLSRDGDLPSEPLTCPPHQPCNSALPAAITRHFALRTCLIFFTQVFHFALFLNPRD